MALTPRDTILVIGSTMRLTRVVVTDDIGGWFVRYPLWRWASERNPVPPAPQVGSLANTNTWEPTWRDKIAGGLDCPFCVGYWIGAGVISATALTSPHGKWGKLWRFVMATLALNEVTAHLGSRLGDVAQSDD